MTNPSNRIFADSRLMNSTAPFDYPPQGDKPQSKRSHAGVLSEHASVVNAEGDGVDRRAMGPLERAQYKKAYRLFLAVRSHERWLDEKARHDARREEASKAATDAAVAALRASGAKVDRDVIAARLMLDEGTSWTTVGDSHGAERKRPPSDTPGAGALATILLSARLADRDPSARSALLERQSAVVLIDVPDSTALSRVIHNWKQAWLPDNEVVVAWKKAGLEKLERWGTTAVQFTATAQRKSGKDGSSEYLAVSTLASSGVAMVGISPDARSCLPECLVTIATHRLTFPALDAETIRLAIRIVTGQSCHSRLEPDIVKHLTFDDLPLAIRTGRSPRECMEKLKDIVKRREKTKDARDLSLDELHGLDEAVAWAKASLRDLEDFKAGKIGWADIDHGVVLDGPPGTGKTTFARVFAAEAGLPLVTGTLSQWQGSGPGHLGSLLAAMRECFDSARRQAPAVVFIDEVDAFADRSKVTHDHKDYVIEVVNGLLEQLDGLAGREGLIFIAASNDVRRCDPAILRAGRLNRVIRVPLPTRDDLVKMLRVRLRDDLREVALDEAALTATGYTGADVERAVKDARRAARHAERAMTLDDLMDAIAGTEDPRDASELRRAAIHEAGHALLAARDFGSDRVTVTIRRRGNTGGGVQVSNWANVSLSTRADLDREVIRLLAGRAAEDVLLSDLSVGAGGSADSDLAKATAYVASMACSFGLIGSMPLLYQGTLIEGDALVLTPDMRKIVHAALVKRYARARALIRENREIVEAIANALLERKTLSGAELGHIIASQPPQDEDGSVPQVDPDIDDFDELDLGVEVSAPWNPRPRKTRTISTDRK